MNISVNSFILFLEFEDKILVWLYQLFFFISSYNDVCGKCMHTIRETLPAFFFFFLQIGKTIYKSSVSLSPYHIVGESDSV